MKSKIFFSCIIVFSFLVSCRDKAEEVTGENQDSNPAGFVLTEPVCTVESFHPDEGDSDPLDMVESRSQLTFGSSGLDFSWDGFDFLKVYVREEDPEVSYQYKIRSWTEGSPVATFKSLSTPKPSVCYLAFKCEQHSNEVEHDDMAVLANRDNITVSYAGQTQVRNNSTAHLGKYDYMAAAAVAGNDAYSDFHFKHLGLNLYLNFDFNKRQNDDRNIEVLKTVRWTKVEMYSDDNDFLQPVREFSLRTGLPQEGAVDGYAPALKEINVEENRNAERFSVNLREHTDDNCPEKDNGKCPHGISMDANQRIKAFIALPPFNFNGTRRLIFRITGKQTDDSEISYYAVRDRSASLRAGTAVQFNLNPIPTSNFDLKVKLHLNWHNKVLFNTSRAGEVDQIGDPGDKEGFVKPTYLYAWIFKNGDNKLAAKKFFGPEELPANLWTEDVHNAYIYNGDFVFRFSLDASVDECNVYVAASTTDLGFWDDGKNSSNYSNGMNEADRNNLILGTLNTTTEEEIRALTFDLTSSTIEDIRNVWSTPYTSESGAFIGTVYNGMNINLHHVAAKVDMQWNCENPVTSFSLKNVRWKDLKLFEPTKNEPTQAVEVHGKILNPTFENNSAAGWTIDNSVTVTGVSYGCAEFYNKTYNMHQTISGLAPGKYRVSMQGFYRDGGDGPDPAAAKRAAGTENLNAILYATAQSGTVEKPLVSIFEGAGKCPGVGSTSNPNFGGLVPNDMAGASQYLAKGLYNNSLVVTVGSDGNLTIGLKKTQAVARDWTFFDNFQLQYLDDASTLVGLDYSPDVDQWYNGRKVFYIPQTAPLISTDDDELRPYLGYTLLHIYTNRKNSQGENVEKNTPVPFSPQEVYPSWFRANVTIKD